MLYRTYDGGVTNYSIVTHPTLLTGYDSFQVKIEFFEHKYKLWIDGVYSADGWFSSWWAGTKVGLFSYPNGVQGNEVDNLIVTSIPNLNGDMIFYDDFIDEGVRLENHTPVLGPAWVHDYAGYMSCYYAIVKNESANSTYPIYTQDIGISDYKLYACVSVFDTSYRSIIKLKHQDADNCLELQFNASRIYLYKKVAGIVTLLDDQYIGGYFYGGKVMTYSITVNGDNISIKSGGTEFASFTESYLQDLTTIGISASGDTNGFSEFTVFNLGPHE